MSLGTTVSRYVKIVPRAWNDLPQKTASFHPFGTAWNVRNENMQLFEKTHETMERKKERLGAAESRSVPPFLLGGYGGNDGTESRPWN